jgi:hypothetical protein
VKNWLIVAAVAFIGLIGGAQSQQPGVTVIGAVTPGNCTQFASTLQLRDAGAPCGGTGVSVTSVFGRTGVVVAQPNDYTLTQIAPGSVAATGGTIDGTVMGGTTRAAGSFTSVAISTPLPVASGGTGDAGTAWTTYTPSPSCGTATFTVNSARSKTMGKTTWIQGDFTIATLGTCTTTVFFNLPVPSNSVFSLSMAENAVSGAVGTCLPAALAVMATQAACFKHANTVFAAGARMIFSGVYENQ